MDGDAHLEPCDGCEEATPVDELTTIQEGIWPLRYCPDCLQAAGLAS